MRPTLRNLAWSAILCGSLASTIHAAPPVLPVPDTIKAEGVPPIPLTLSEALNRYQNIRSASFQDWAADGSGMYIITRFADVPQVHFVATAGGARTQLTFLPERVLDVQARPKHKQFLYSIDQGGAENYQLFLQDHKPGAQPRRLTDGKSRNLSPKMVPLRRAPRLEQQRPQRQATWTSTRSPPPTTEVGFVRLFKEVTGQWTVADWSPDESKVAALEYISINESYVHIVDVATGKTETD